MGSDAVLADADDHGVLCREGVIQLSEGLGLTGTARGIVLGVKVQDDLLSREIFQTDDLSVLICQGNGGGFASQFQHGTHSFYLWFAAFRAACAGQKPSAALYHSRSRGTTGIRDATLDNVDILV